MEYDVVKIKRGLMGFALLMTFSLTSLAEKSMDPEIMRQLEVQIATQQKEFEKNRYPGVTQRKQKAMGGYGDVCMDKVRSNFNNTIFTPNVYGTVLVEVFVREDGKLHKAELFRQSGNKDLDDKVIRLIETSAPFPPAPKEVTEHKAPKTTLIMQYYWKFTRVQSNTMDSQIQLSKADNEDLRFPE